MIKTTKIFLLLFLLLSNALAEDIRAIELFKEVRCLVCQGQTIHESNAELAEDIKKLILLPLNDLIFMAQNTHKKHFKTTDFQLASLMSIKTGSCPEDCKYCPQSAHFNVNLKKEKLVEVSKVKKAAELAKKNGADRFCMGAAWKKLPKGEDFNKVIEMIKTVKSLELGFYSRPYMVCYRHNSYFSR